MRFTMKTLGITLGTFLLTQMALAAGKAPSGPVAGTVTVKEAEAVGTATISGSVTFEGAAPQREKIKMAADPVCQQQHKEDAFSQEIVAKDGKLQYALVYVKSGASGASPAPTTPVVLDQKGCVYEPHVFGIQAGQPLEIRNSDPTLHNINCQAKENKKFNIAQPTKGMKTTKTFDKPELAIPFKCNVHPWMAAYGHVFSHSFFSVSGADGSFSIAGLPAGTYTVEAWHEKLGTHTQEVTVTDGETKSVSFSFKR